MAKYEYEITPYKTEERYGGLFGRRYAREVILWRVQVVGDHNLVLVRAEGLFSEHEARIWLDEWIRIERDALNAKRKLIQGTIKGTLEL